MSGAAHRVVPFGARHPCLDANLIATRVWQGAFPFAADLRQLGFTFAVFAAAECQPSPADFPGVRIARVGLDDNFEEPLSDPSWRAVLDVAGRAARHHRRDRGTLYISCNAGQNRSGLVTALVLAQLLPTTPINRIITAIQRRREGALTNPRFVEALRARLAEAGD